MKTKSLNAISGQIPVKILGLIPAGRIPNGLTLGRGSSRWKGRGCRGGEWVSRLSKRTSFDRTFDSEADRHNYMNVFLSRHDRQAKPDGDYTLIKPNR